MLLESCIISLFASVPFSSAYSVDSESVKMTMFAIAREFVSKVWLMCVTDVLIASCSAMQLERAFLINWCILWFL